MAEAAQIKRKDLPKPPAKKSKFPKGSLAREFQERGIKGVVTGGPEAKFVRNLLSRIRGKKPPAKKQKDKILGVRG